MKRTYNTYKAVLVTDVVRQLQLVEGDHFLHPLLAGGRAVRMDVHPFRHLRVGFPSDHPTTDNNKNINLSEYNQ